MAEKQAQKIQVILGSEENCPVVYSNYLAVNHIPHDFCLTFGLVVVPEELEAKEKLKKTGKLRAQPVAKIIIPTSLIKSVIDVLQINIEKYEKEYGSLVRGPEGHEEEEKNC